MWRAGKKIFCVAEACRRGWSIPLLSVVQSSLSRQVARFLPSLCGEMDARTLDSRWKSPLFCLSSVVRWWTLWSPTQLHAAPSCTTSLIRSLRSWRTTSTSAAAKPEPASLFCSPSRPAAFLLPTRLLGSATKEEAFGRVFPTDCYCSSSVKDSDLERQHASPKSFPTTRTATLYKEPVGLQSSSWCLHSSWDLHQALMAIFTHWTPHPLFCKGTSQWCTAL